MKSIFFFVALLFAIDCDAQNLVPNPSFEDTVECPVSTSQIFKAENWMSFSYTPDYYHGCDNNINGVVGVPNNWLAFQNAHTGVAYGGFIAYDLTGAPAREYLAVGLTEKTIVGVQYFVTFYLSWASAIGFTLAINKLGIALTNGIYSEITPYPISNNPAAYDNSFYTDSVGWSKVSLSFIADSAYKYLVIGDFFDDEHTDTLQLGEFNVHCYYFIDDVCLSANQGECDKDLGNPESSNIVDENIFPVPANSILNITSPFPTTQIKIRDIFGKVVYQNSSLLFEKHFSINCSSWVNGTYLLELNKQFHKISIQH